MMQRVLVIISMFRKQSSSLFYLATLARTVFNAVSIRLSCLLNEKLVVRYSAASKITSLSMYITSDQSTYLAVKALEVRC